MARAATAAPPCAAALLVLLGGWSGDARACGGFFTEVNTSDVATMSDIRVALVQHAGRVDQYVQVAYSGTTRDFAWIYPVAANPDVSEPEVNPFPALEEASRPRITIRSEVEGGGGGGFGCGSAVDAASAPGGRQVDPTVRLWQSGQVGSFDYVVISAASSADLLTWLNDNGFAVPQSTEQALSHYVAQGWVFVAMKVTVTPSGKAEVPSTTVLRLSYAADEVRYPLHMVSLSPAAETSIELFLVTEQQDKALVPVDQFSAQSIERSQVQATSSDTSNYQQVFEQTLAAAGPRGLVREFAATSWSPAAAGFSGLPSGLVLTRLRGRLTPEVMDRDMRFAAVPHERDVYSHYDLYFDGEATSPAATPWLLVLLLGAWRLGRRRWW